MSTPKDPVSSPLEYQIKALWDKAADNKLETGIPYKYGDNLPTVPAHLRAQIEAHCIETGIPYIAAVSLIASESGFNAKAISPTKAAGLAQANSNTLFETLYKLAQDGLLTEDHNALILDNIEKYNSAEPGRPYWWSYRIKDDGDEKAIRALAHDEDIGLKVAFHHMEFSIKEGTRIYRNNIIGRTDWMGENEKTIIKALQERSASSPSNPTLEQAEKHNSVVTNGFNRIAELNTRIDAIKDELHRTFTVADLKVFYVCGSQGGAGLLEALADPVKRAQRHRAADYVPRNIVESNEALFYKDYPENKTFFDVSEFYENIINKVGTTPLPEHLITRIKPETPEPPPLLLDPNKP